MQDDFDMAEGTLAPGAGLIFPANRDSIIALAEKKRLPPDVIEDLRKIPDKIYTNIGELVAVSSKLVR